MACSWSFHQGKQKSPLFSAGAEHWALPFKDILGFAGELEVTPNVLSLQKKEAVTAYDLSQDKK